LIANAAYYPSCSSTIADTHIPGEAARVRTLSIIFLKTQINLTISYDGGTTHRPQSVYTVHFTTPDGRSFLIEGEESSDTCRRILEEGERPGNGHSGGKSVTDSGGLSLGPLWGRVSCSAIFSRSLVPPTHVTPYDTDSY
jgi:hypothetical protein